MITLNEALAIHSRFVIGEKESRTEAAEQLARIQGSNRKRFSLEESEHVLKAALHYLLDSECYGIAAVLCWGLTLFDPRPKSVRLIWHGMQRYPQLLIYGAGSMGKSYTVIVRGLLDQERDWAFTTTKLVSTTAGHERAQTFSNLVRLHRYSCVPFQGYIQQGFIGLDKDDKRSSISEVAIDKGEDKGAKLQGFHPLPRPFPHPKFGVLTRVRGYFDEAEDTASGLWQGEANMMLTMDDEIDPGIRDKIQPMHVAITAMWNPKNRASIAAQKAEPVGGYDALDERLDEYTSAKGYHVIRLDARKCENVVARKTIFHGLQTYKGFKRLEEQGGAQLSTFGYGIYPTQAMSFGIISPSTLAKCRGSYIWAGPCQEVAAEDMAEEGPDRVVLTSAKYGPAIAFVPEKGETKKFAHPRNCIQFEQQISLPKKDTIVMGAETVVICKRLRVHPTWFGLDVSSTVTMRDWMRRKWGEVIGIRWGEKATDRTILEENVEKASDLFLNIKTEMWFAFNAWAEFGYVSFTPNMDTHELFNELSSMRYKHVGKTLKRCEKTAEFKLRNAGKSPDLAASAVMVVHVVRSHAQAEGEATSIPAMDPKAPKFSYEDVMADAGELLEDSSETHDELELIY